MKYFYLLTLSLMISSLSVFGANEFYKPLDKMKPDLHTHYYRAAILTEKKYIVPKYKEALAAYKKLKLLQAGKVKLPPAEIEKLKKLIETFKAWEKLSKLYYKTHLAQLAGDLGKSKDKNNPQKGDDVSKQASVLHAKSSLQLFRFFKENPDLTKEKNFKVPLREIHHTTSEKHYAKTSLSKDQRAAVLELANTF